MKRYITFLRLTIAVIFSTFMLYSCDNSNDENITGEDELQEYIIGKWRCDVDAYGQELETSMIIAFNNNGTGYTWWMDESFSEREVFIYNVTSSKIKIKTDEGWVELRYELYGSTLIIYGLGEDDMSELRFKRANLDIPSDDIGDNDGDENGPNQDAEQTVSTEAKVLLSPTKATLYGFLKGVTDEIEVGFLLSLSPKPTQGNSRTITLTSAGGRFDATINGILDQEIYYYQSYAKINGENIYGEVRSFETGPLTYTVNGKEFQVIKVEGGPYGTFSILQTEVSAKDKIVFAGIDLEIIPDCDKVDGHISLYESKKFIGNMAKKTGFQWRYPSSAEWMFAAEGGLKSKKYTYSGSNDINDVAWYKENCSGPRESAQKKANELGIYDMSGNFAEMTNDNILKDLETNTHAYTAAYFDWNKFKTYGGYWNDSADKCKIYSSDDLKFLELNLIDGNRYCFRFIYSHHINAYYFLTK